MTMVTAKIPPSDYLPLQMQANQLLQDHDYVLYGGSRGPGKSYWLRWKAIELLVQWYRDTGIKGITGGLFCETFPALKDRHLSKIEKEVPSFIGTLKDSKAHGLALHLVQGLGGGILRLGNLDDPSKYQSAEFALIAVDELTKNLYNTFDELRGSMRYPGIAKPKFLAATNPGGIGHLWVKALWVDSDFSGHPHLEKVKHLFAFVRALPGDNPHLTKEYYDQVLGTLAPELQKAWRDGSWDVFQGQVFSEWDPTRHIYTPRNIPPHWLRRRGIDPGYKKPACCLWGATDPHTGRLYIYREAYGAGQTDEDMARLIKAASHDESYQVSFADPALWQPKNMQGIITSGADEFAAEGIPLMKGDNRRLNGKAKVHRILADLPDGMPGLVISAVCKNLIRTLPALPYSQKAGKLEDVDTEAEDHAYDALRYLLSSLAPGTKKGDNEPDPETQKWIQQQEMLSRAFG